MDELHRWECIRSDMKGSINLGLDCEGPKIRAQIKNKRDEVEFWKLWGEVLLDEVKYLRKRIMEREGL